MVGATRLLLRRSEAQRPGGKRGTTFYNACLAELPCIENTAHPAWKVKEACAGHPRETHFPARWRRLPHLGSPIEVTTTPSLCRRSGLSCPPPALRLVRLQGIKNKSLLGCTGSAACCRRAFLAPLARPLRPLALTEAAGLRGLPEREKTQHWFTHKVSRNTVRRANSTATPRPALHFSCRPAIPGSVAPPLPALAPLVRTAPRLAAPSLPPAVDHSAGSRGCFNSSIVNRSWVLMMPNRAQAGMKQHAP